MLRSGQMLHLLSSNTRDETTCYCWSNLAFFIEMITLSLQKTQVLSLIVRLTISSHHSLKFHYNSVGDDNFIEMRATVLTYHISLIKARCVSALFCRQLTSVSLHFDLNQMQMTWNKLELKLLKEVALLAIQQKKF